MKNQEFRLVISRLIKSYMEGVFQSVVLEPAGEDLSHARDFEIGDDPRKIEALPTFQRRHPTVYERMLETGANIYFLIDGSRSLRFGSGDTTKHEYSNELVGTICRACLEEGNKFFLILFTDHNEYESGLIITGTALEEKIAELARFEPKAKTTNLKKALKYFSLNFQELNVGKPSITFILSDFIFEPDFASELRQLSEQTDTVAILISDPAELNLPKPRFGLVRLVDSETGKTLIARTPRRALDIMPPILKKCGVDWISANTGQEIGKTIENLAELFQKKEN